MPDIFYLVSKWWKPMLFLVIVSLAAVAVVIFMEPSQYVAIATAVPANTAAADKSRIFNENIENLYSPLGSPDDLNVIVGTATLDTVYLVVTDAFNLFDHYQISSNRKEPRTVAAAILKKYSRVMKSEYGELKVKVWDTDKNLAPQLANAIMDKLEAIHRDLRNGYNKTSLQSLQAAQKKIQFRIDSIDNHPGLAKGEEEMNNSRRKVLMEQWQQNEKLIGEYQLMLENNPPVLNIIEKAKAPDHADRPRRVAILIATAFLSLFFALLAALVLEKTKKNNLA